ncbi:MAG: NifB/NifX family molybdenum-iron cluster-binding protein [Bacteroidales bacterium]|nr:NifB/NifX family molybdenum-iron cluster-binding protein [Bacteroidales bacterium]
MKIAVPTIGNVVDSHFGHCAFYSIFEVEDNKIISKQILPSPQGCGCKSGIAVDLRKMGVGLMLAGNMGEGAKNVLNNNSITVVRGCSGDVDMLVEEYLKGGIADSGVGCNAHGDGHVCSNH